MLIVQAVVNHGGKDWLLSRDPLQAFLYFQLSPVQVGLRLPLECFSGIFYRTGVEAVSSYRRGSSSPLRVEESQLPDDFSPGGLTSRINEIELDNWDFLVEGILSGSVSFLQLRKCFWDFKFTNRYRRAHGLLKEHRRLWCYYSNYLMFHKPGEEASVSYSSWAGVGSPSSG